MDERALKILHISLSNSLYMDLAALTFLESLSIFFSGYALDDGRLADHLAMPAGRRLLYAAIHSSANRLETDLWSLNMALFPILMLTMAIQSGLSICRFLSSPTLHSFNRHQPNQHFIRLILHSDIAQVSGTH